MFVLTKSCYHLPRTFNFDLKSILTLCPLCLTKLCFSFTYILWSSPVLSYLVFRVCWPLEWSLNPCLLHCPCLQSLACTLSLWLVSHVQLATSLSMVSHSDVAHNNELVKLAGISVHALLYQKQILVLILTLGSPAGLQNILPASLTFPIFCIWTQVTTRQCLGWPVIACWRACLVWRVVAVWWRSFPPFLVSNSAHHYHGQKLSEPHLCYFHAFNYSLKLLVWV